MSMRSRGRSSGQTTRRPPPPQFKPPPLPEEDDGVFIRPITRSRSPHLAPPPPVSGNLSPVVEVDTPESSRSDSPMSTWSRNSASPRTISPAPFVVSHDTFIKQGNLSATPGPREPLKPKKLVQDDTNGHAATDVSAKPAAGKVQSSAASLQQQQEQRIHEPAVSSSGRHVPSMTFEPPTPPVKRPAEDIAPLAASEHDGRVATPKEQKRQAQHISQASDEPLSKASKLEGEENDQENVDLTERFPAQEETFKPSKFKRRQSKKIQPKKSFDAAPKSIDNKSQADETFPEEDIDLSAKNLTSKEHHVMTEVLNARRSRSRSNSRMSVSPLPAEQIEPTILDEKSKQNLENESIKIKMQNQPSNVESEVQPSQNIMEEKLKKERIETKIEPTEQKTQLDQSQGKQDEKEIPKKDFPLTKKKKEEMNISRLRQKDQTERSGMKLEQIDRDQKEQTMNSSSPSKVQDCVEQVVGSQDKANAPVANELENIAESSTKDNGLSMSQVKDDELSKSDVRESNLLVKNDELPKSEMKESKLLVQDDELPKSVIQETSLLESESKEANGDQTRKEKVGDIVIPDFVDNIADLTVEKLKEHLIREEETNQALKEELENLKMEVDDDDEKTPTPEALPDNSSPSVDPVQTSQDTIKKPKEDIEQMNGQAKMPSNILGVQAEQLSEINSKENALPTKANLKEKALSQYDAQKKDTATRLNLKEKSSPQHEEQIKDTTHHLDTIKSVEKDAKKSPLISSTSSKTIKDISKQSDVSLKSTATVEKSTPNLNKKVNKTDSQLSNLSAKSTEKHVKDSCDISPGPKQQSSAKLNPSVPRSKVNTGPHQNSESFTGRQDKQNERKVLASKKEQQLQKIQEFLKDPDKPDEEVKINFRLKNQGKEFEVHEALPGLHFAGLEALSRPDLAKFDVVILSSSRSHPELVHQNILQIYPGEEKRKLDDLYSVGTGRKQVLVCGEGGDPAVLAAAVISRKKKVSVREAANLVKKNVPGCKINQALILRLSDEETGSSMINWKVWIPLALIGLLIYYLMKSFFVRLDEEHKQETGGGDDYSYFNIRRWP